MLSPGEYFLTFFYMSLWATITILRWTCFRTLLTTLASLLAEKCFALLFIFPTLFSLQKPLFFRNYVMFLHQPLSQGFSAGPCYLSFSLLPARSRTRSAFSWSSTSPRGPWYHSWYTKGLPNSNICLQHGWAAKDNSLQTTWTPAVSLQYSRPAPLENNKYAKTTNQLCFHLL